MKTQRIRLRAVAALVTFAGALALISTGIWGTLAAQAAENDDEKEAHIVVQFDESDAVIRPISFTGTITGFRALELTGLDIEYTDEFGAPFVCSIEGVGCPADNCFCDPDRSWGYWYWDGGDWASHTSGAGTTPLSTTGAIEGWQWGKWMEQPAPAPATDLQAALRGLDYLQERQSAENGSYGGKVSPSLGVMLAAGANHQDADQWRRGPDSPSLMDYLSVAGIGYSHEGAAEAGRLAVAVAGADGCWPPRAVQPSHYYDPAVGAMSDQAGFLSWAILGSVSISEALPSGNVDYLRGLAQPSGGWEWSPTWGVDTNTTAIAIQALVASGVPVSATEIVSGLAYLKSMQLDDGGFAYQQALPPNPTLSDANSTAWVVQALYATAEDPRSDEWKESGHSAIDYLLSLQLADGSFEFATGSGGDEYATRQVVPALLGSVHPIQIQELAVCDVDATMLPALWSAEAGVQ